MKTPQKLTNEQLLGLKQGEKLIEFIGGHFFPYKFESIHSTGKYVILSSGERIRAVHTNIREYPKEELYLASECSKEFIGKKQIDELKREIEFLKEQYGVKDEAPKTQFLQVVGQLNAHKGIYTTENSDINLKDEVKKAYELAQAKKEHYLESEYEEIIEISQEVNRILEEKGIKAIGVEVLRLDSL